MNSKTKTFLKILLTVVAVTIFCHIAGCATAPTTMRGSVPLSFDEATAVTAGPGHGHWNEEADRTVIVYTVRGVDCNQLSGMGKPSYDSKGWFALAAGETLCVLPLRAGQRVAFHVTRP